jgi:hypothetical protein
MDMRVLAPQDSVGKGASPQSPTGQLDLIEPAEVKLAALIEKQSSDDFDWIKDDSIVVEEQPAIAVCTNNRNHIVIRQAGGYDKDSFVIIAPHNMAAFIDRLCEMAGIPGVGKRR